MSPVRYGRIDRRTVATADRAPPTSHRSMNGKIATHCYQAISLPLWALIAVPIFLHAAEAASLLYSEVKGASEKSIWCNPELLHLNNKISATGRGMLRSLSASGRAEFRYEERVTRIVCLRQTVDSATNRIVSCLRDFYEKRQKQLDSAVVKSGSMIIRRVHRYSVSPSAGAGSGGVNSGFNTTTVSFPKIDNPRNEHERNWNRLIAQHEVAGQQLTRVSATASASPEDDEDLSVDYVLGSFSPRMISLWFLIYADAHKHMGHLSTRV